VRRYSKMTIGSESLRNSPVAEDLYSGIKKRLISRSNILHMDAGSVGAQLSGPLDRDESVCSTFADARRCIAPGFGCDASELVITHSTTDGLCRIIAGLDLREGDEILTTNNEHYGTLAPLAMIRDRRGVVIRKISLPVGDNHCAEDYISLFDSGFTEKTRILWFSAPTSTLGAMLPITMLARLAQHHGCVCVVDGAHIPGMLHCKFEELGVDFLAGSGTKWQCGPPGTGILYIRNRVLPRFNPRPLPAFWPVISIWYPLEGGLPPRTTWAKPSYDIAEYLQTCGSSSLLRVQAFQAACEVWDQLGRDRIEHYLLDLNSYLKDRIVDVWGRASLYSPRSDRRLHSAIAAFDPFKNACDGWDENKFRTFVARLESDHRILVRYTEVRVPSSNAPRHAIRIATRILHNRADVDRLIVAMEKVSASM
jgi:isopenicillin-N epimerase